jgi:VanZ family protein
MTRTPPSRHGVVLRWTLWWIALCVWTALLVTAQGPSVVASVVPDHQLPVWVSKAGHVIGYAVLAVMVGSLPVRPAIRNAWWLFLVSHACLTEWIQTFVEGRTGSLRDVLLDVLGITLGLLVLQCWQLLRRT